MFVAHYYAQTICNLKNLSSGPVSDSSLQFDKSRRLLFQLTEKKEPTKEPKKGKTEPEPKNTHLNVWIKGN